MSAFAGLPYLAASVLAAVFIVAAVAKWRDPPGTARAFRALGVPRPWTAARVVPAVEAALAAGLLLRPAWSGALALALLVGFTVFLINRLRAGVSVPCNCFGGWGAGDLSWADVARNGWLIAAATMAVGGVRPQRPTALAAGVGLLALAAAALTVRWAGRA